MKSVTSSIRIVLGLVSLSISALLLAGLLGLIPNIGPSAQRNRTAFCESAAVSFMALAPRMNQEQVGEIFSAIRERNSEVESIAVRRANGEILVSSGPHAEIWQTRGENPADSREFIVPIMAAGERWGQLEVRFVEVMHGPLGWLMRPEFSLSLFVGCLLFATFTFYLKTVLKQLDPARVIPPRVREALDALAEGLLVVDRNGVIVLANSAFSQHTGLAGETLMGKRIADLGFHRIEEAGRVDAPWVQTLESGDTQRGVLMKLATTASERTFSISAVAVRDERRRCQGVVVSFEDVTELDRKQKELREALLSLKQSSDEISERNRELEWLATRDALTGCFNRRSFFNVFEMTWNSSEQHRQSLSVVMVDIDHFKSINDTHGHSKGDEVLRKVAAAVMRTVTEDCVVCRYGGEEFSVLMPQTPLDDAELLAERIRLAIKGLKPGNVPVTASLGVSCAADGAVSPQDLLDQADKCLYVAKRHGRNQVVRFDKARDRIAQLGETPITSRREPRKPEHVTIPYQAVSALLAAMAFRDQPTAAHSRRVADLCVATGEGLLSMRDCYTLEMAALMHDIGKISIPDAILQKSGRLSTEEWTVMQRHKTVGVQLVRSSFGSELVAEIIATYGIWYDLSRGGHGVATPQRPAISARILAIADAFDSMTSDTLYRRRKSRTEAFDELRRCAGTQFDPELVERFVNAVRLRSGDRTEMPGVSTDIALDIGQQIERLVAALDDQNLDDLRDLTERLRVTADRAGLDNMADTAKQLCDSLEHDKDLIAVMQSANELLDLCRLTQVSLVQGDLQRLNS
jgi:diguanylate cyclase (GGDEF)-like protein/PAS domain S-box-containing protein